MENIQIKLAALWTCLMLTYLLGDVLRIFSGDFKPVPDFGRARIQPEHHLVRIELDVVSRAATVPESVG